MTQIPPPDPSQDAPALFNTGIDAVVQNASRLGLTWEMLIATVIDGSDSSAVLAVCDGDSVNLTMVSMAGTLYEGERVYVIKVPPSGLYIAGRITQVNYIPVSARALNSNTTSSNTFTDMDNFGPTVSAVIGPSGRALVTLTADMFADFTGRSAIMSYSVSGATVRGASTTGNMLYLSNQVNGLGLTDLGACSVVNLDENLTPGINIFTARYRARFPGGTVGFGNRTITVQSL